jgi:hypothetical protein
MKHTNRRLVMRHSLIAILLLPLSGCIETAPPPPAPKPVPIQKAEAVEPAVLEQAQAQSAEIDRQGQ